MQKLSQLRFLFYVAINEITAPHVWWNHVTLLKYGLSWQGLNCTSRRPLLAVLFVSNMEWPVTVWNHCAHFDMCNRMCYMKAFAFSLFHSGSCHIGWSLSWSNAWIKSENRATGWNIQPSPGTIVWTGATCSIATKVEAGKLLHTVFCSYDVSTVWTLQNSSHIFTFYWRCCSWPGTVLVQFLWQPGRPTAVRVTPVLRDIWVCCCIHWHPPNAVPVCYVCCVQCFITWPMLMQLVILYICHIYFVFNFELFKKNLVLSMNTVFLFFSQYTYIARYKL